MKRILLASASIVAFAGAASAEVIFSGDATLGYNDTVSADPAEDNHDGFYWETNLALGAAVELNNGITATLGFDIDVNENDLSGDLSTGGLFISLVSDEAGLYFGNTQFAAEKNWVNVDEMAGDGFSEEDGETVIRGDITFSGVNASLSYAVADADGDVPDADIDQLSLGATTTFGAFALSFAYQEESDAAPGGTAGVYSAENDFTTDEILGLSASSVFSGVDTLIGYAENMTQGHTSIGVAVSYPFGPVSLVGFYVMEDGPLADEDAFGIGFDYANGPITLEARYKEVNGEDDSRVEGTYDVGNGITGLFGLDDGGDDYYVGAKVDLGADASLLATYAVDDSGDSADEIGNGDYQEGATVELTMNF
jgi:outer membrane protein OmpU